jgi:cation:H+ antiporter
MDLMTSILFAAGLVLLIGGAELLVRGASGLATRVGISPLVIGLTVVAFGTSSPELAVSVSSAWSGEADIALGNVIGSNIFNVLFILGVAALIAPLVVAQQLIRLDVPIMIGATVLVLLMALDGAISRFDGVLLFAGIVAYTGFLIWQSRRETSTVVLDEYDEAYAQSPHPAPAWPVQAGFVIAGLALLVLGSRWLVNGAVSLADTIGVSDIVIGLTIVAAGTSLPEVATSIIASIRGERDIAVGNVVGSSIFNLLAVLGLSSAVSPEGIGVASAMVNFDIPVAVAVAVACLPIFFTGHLIARWEGAVFHFLFFTMSLHNRFARMAISGQCGLRVRCEQVGRVIHGHPSRKTTVPAGDPTRLHAAVRTPPRAVPKPVRARWYTAPS